MRYILRDLKQKFKQLDIISATADKGAGLVMMNRVHRKNFGFHNKCIKRLIKTESIHITRKLKQVVNKNKTLLETNNCRPVQYEPKHTSDALPA